MEKICSIIVKVQGAIKTPRVVELKVQGACLDASLILLRSLTQILEIHVLVHAFASLLHQC